MNDHLFQSVNQLAGNYPMLDWFMAFVTQKALFIYIALFVLMWVFGSEKRKYTVFLAGCTGLLALMINAAIGEFYYVQRPFVVHDDVHLLLPHAADASFPSDHTTGAFALSFGVFLFYRKLGAVMILFAALTGISRIYVGHHYPLDVIGSIVAALAASAVVYKYRRYLDPIPGTLIDFYHRIPFFQKKEEKRSL
ncbi:undecaprenyl-diphosphatase [Mesobacillus foraminis]|uniref:Undecaprenyl-diphosphatase n=1 Tax=Mesobacillus foraminis TaxID=279826 RepID=A0A4R2BDC7_9BACI|nr:undecaprenyl-diphosphatase [Mesobacillus foraminis]TCN24222.1 undecaprenyl-diphosphatase [Mesobacillus foraminis]